MSASLPDDPPDRATRPMRQLLVGTVVLALAWGAWLRLAGVERKLYWHDEVMTWLALAGRTPADVGALYDGRPRRAADLKRFLEPSPERGVAATTAAVLAQEPHHAPLYFVLTRAAARWGEVGPRSVSVVAGLLAVMLIGLLGRTLFGDVQAGWAAAGLAALSPLHVRYAQEARPYALASLALLAASLAFLRAVRSAGHAAWLLYGAAAAVALYAHPLCALVLLGHAVFAGLQGRAWKRAAAALLLAAALFAPWALASAAGRERAEAMMSWAGERQPLASLAKRWAGIATAVFVRAGDEGGLGAAYPVLAAPLARAGLALLVLALLAAAVRELVGAWPRETWLFVVLLGLVPALGLALPDLLWGGRRSTVPRYLAPCWLALELTVAAWVGRALRGEARTRAWARLGALLLLLVAGGASAFSAAPLRTWWDTNPEALRAVLVAAQRVDARAGAQVVSDTDALWLLVLSRELGDDVTLRLLPAPVGSRELAEALQAPGPLFLYRPSAELLRAGLATRPTLALCVASPDVRLWCSSER